MCAERLQRILMAVVIGVVIVLFNSGYMLFGNILGGFVILMILAWAFSNFCPSIWIFEKFFGKCNWGNKSE